MARRRDRGDRVGDRLGDEQGRDDAAAIFGRKPVGEIQDHARKESGLRGSEQKANDQKAGGPVTSAVRPEMMPQVIMIRAIQIRAPIFSRIRLLGISNRK